LSFLEKDLYRDFTATVHNKSVQYGYKKFAFQQNNSLRNDLNDRDSDFDLNRINSRSETFSNKNNINNYKDLKLDKINAKWQDSQSSKDNIRNDNVAFHMLDSDVYSQHSYQANVISSENVGIDKINRSSELFKKNNSSVVRDQNLVSARSSVSASSSLAIGEESIANVALNLQQYQGAKVDNEDVSINSIQSTSQKGSQRRLNSQNTQIDSDDDWDDRSDNSIKIANNISQKLNVTGRWAYEENKNSAGQLPYDNLLDQQSRFGISSTKQSNSSNNVQNIYQQNEFKDQIIDELLIKIQSISGSQKSSTNLEQVADLVHKIRNKKENLHYKQNKVDNDHELQKLCGIAIENIEKNIDNYQNDPTLINKHSNILSQNHVLNVANIKNFNQECEKVDKTQLMQQEGEQKNVIIEGLRSIDYDLSSSSSSSSSISSHSKQDNQKKEFTKAAILGDKFKLYKVEEQRQSGHGSCVYKFELANKDKQILPDQYLSVHYDEKGKLAEIKTPSNQKIQFSSSAPYIKVNGCKYFIPIKKENLQALQQKIPVNKFAFKPYDNIELEKVKFTLQKNQSLSSSPVKQNNLIKDNQQKKSF